LLLKSNDFQLGTGIAVNTTIPVYIHPNLGIRFTYSQQIFTKWDLNQQGITAGPQLISKLRFYIANNSNSSGWDNWTVFMANRSDSTFLSATSFLSSDSMTTVYNGPITPPNGGWLELTLPTPFEWNGSSNILIAVYDKKTGHNYGSAAFGTFTSTAVSGRFRSIYNYSGTGISTATVSGGTSAGNSTIRNRVQFVMAPSGNCSGTPDGGIISGSPSCSNAPASFALQLTEHSANTGISLQWQESADSTTWTNVSSGGTASCYTTPTLSSKTYYRCVVTCSNSGSTATSSVFTAKVFLTPSIVAPADVTVAANSSGCEATGVSLGSASYPNNCSTATVTNDHASTTYPLGVTTVTWTITDALGQTATATQTVTVTTSASAGITNNSATTELTCTQTSIGFTATGGSTYAWSGGLAATATATISTPDTYTVTITDSNGCTDTESIAITQDIAVTAGITNNTGTTVLTCATTSLSMTATGGVSYVWSGGLGSTANATVTAPATYTVTATAANGCTDTESITITQDITAPTAIITNNTGNTELTCSRTAISLTASGAVSYAWSGGLGSNAGASVTSLGTYTVTATASNGCTDTESIIITQDITNPTAVITNNTGNTELTCARTAISLTASGAVSYAWSGGLGNNASAAATSPATYTVTATAANGCTDTESITITQDITVPGAGITNNSGSTILTCSLTSISVTATTTTGTSYAWSGGATPGTAANSFSSPGTYTVTVTGANGCTSTANITITQDINAPTAVITNNTGSTELTCSRTAISLIASGAVSYAWSGGLGNNASAAATSPATYTVTATAANGCTDTESITITQDISVPTATITNNTGNSELTCSRAAISLTASGAVSYVWSGGLGSNASASATSPATYTVSATAANGCTDTESITITQNIDAPVITVHPTRVSQKVSSNFVPPAFTVSATGTSPLSYQWYYSNTQTNVGGTLIPGATTTSYVPNTSAPITRFYYCVVSNPNGCAVSSNPSGEFSACAP
jgi:hypothetical protein